MNGSEKKMTGIQKVVLAGFIGIGKGFIENYSMLSKEEKKNWKRKTAERMFDKAMQNKLTENYLLFILFLFIKIKKINMHFKKK